jgi:hypothetical protein
MEAGHLSYRQCGFRKGWDIGHDSMHGNSMKSIRDKTGAYTPDQGLWDCQSTWFLVNICTVKFIR